MVNHNLNTSGMLAFRCPSVLIAVASTGRGYHMNIFLERVVFVHCTVVTFAVPSVG